MNPMAAILLDTTAILTIIFGGAGVLLSLGLIFFPERTRTIDSVLSRSYHLKERLAYFDQTVRHELFIYKRPILHGVLFTLGAVITLVFLFVQLDLDRLLAVLHVPANQRLLWQILLEALVLAGKLAGIIGVAIGVFLIIAPGRLQRIEKRLNAWVATQPIVDRLDVFNHVINIFSFRHPILIGTIGLLLSSTLIALSIASFF